MMHIEKLFKKKRFNKEPKSYRILVTENKFLSKGKGVVELVETFFPKYGFEYKVVDDENRDYSDRLHFYEIEIKYSDKDYVDVLLNRVFKFDDYNNHMLLGDYERWLKVERLRRKLLNI